MRWQMRLLALIASAALTCSREKVPEVKAIDNLAQQKPYTLEVSLVGLVGYVNVADGVWALLPKARPADGAAVGDASLPPGTNPSNLHYPAHHAVLKISGTNVRGFGVPIDLRIPIEGYDLQLPPALLGNGPGLECPPFHQEEKNPKKCDAAVDKLAAGMLNSPPVNPDLLAARIKLPRTDLKTYDGTLKFDSVHPGPISGKACPETAGRTETDYRVERVSWSPTLSGDLKLTLQQFKGSSFSFMIGPAFDGEIVKIEIANQVAEAVFDQNHGDSHWASYRWFYSLSDSAAQKDCTQHYYPAGVRGGNRCPQKLYYE